MKNGSVIKKTEDMKTCGRCTVNEEVKYCEVGGRGVEVDGDKLDSERVTIGKERRVGVHGREAGYVRVRDVRGGGVEREHAADDDEVGRRVVRRR